jgi:Ca-activated chloride channel family protein
VNASAMAVCGLLVAASTVMHGADGVPIFKTGVDLVALNVIVTDSQQKLVTGLGAQDFAVFEDGVQQDVSYFAASLMPLDLAILVDTSASMSDKMKTMQEAAVGFASSLRDGDRLTIVDVKDTVKVLHPLDGDLDGARQAIRSTTARGGTALYNGLYMTLKELQKQRRLVDDVRRQAIAVLSDGDDTASLINFDDVMDIAKQAGVAVYTITLRSDYDIRQASAGSSRRYFSNAEFSMRALAQETGARAFFPASITELAGVYDSIAQELASQYALAYTPKNVKRDGAYRRVIVQVTQPGARTRTRAGYMSPRPERIATLLQ